MNITIKIDCETINEFYAHIHQIGKEIKRLARKEKLDPLRDEFKKTEWSDDNCYGEHIVKIRK